MDSIPTAAALSIKRSLRPTNKSNEDKGSANSQNARHEVPMVASKKMIVFWVVAP
jgi:hypothetical protein